MKAKTTTMSRHGVRCQTRNRRRPQAERLEDRTLLTTRPANVFAVFEGELSGSKPSESIRVHLTPQNFSMGNSPVTLGFVLLASEGSNLAPKPVVVSPLNPGNAPTIDTQAGLPGGRSLTLAKLKHGDYDLRVGGVNNSVGAYELRIFLAGDVDGDFAVTDADTALLNDAVNQNNLYPDFLNEGDANRDGKITGYDLARAQENRGVSTAVRVLTVTAGLDPASETGLPADDLVNQTPVGIIGTTVSGAQVTLDDDGDGFDDGTATSGATGYALLADLSPGANTLRVEARDSFGQWARAQTVVTLDDLAPTVLSTSPAPGAVVQEVQGQSIPVSLAFSEPMVGSTVLSSLSVLGNLSGAITPQAASYDEATHTLSFGLAASLTDTAITVNVSSGATDLAGNGLIPGGLNTLNFTVERKASVTEISPANGEQLVSLTRSAIVRFSERIDPTTVTPDAIQVVALGQSVPGSLVVSSTERFVTFIPTDPWPSSTEVRVRVDGSKILARTGEAVDADRDGQAGGIATADFRTLPLTRIPGTEVWGYVYDSYNKNPDGSNIPIVGATVRVDSLPEANAVTDANGYFILKDMPAPEFFVHIDGTTAINAPAGTVYPSVGKPFHSIPGQSTQLNMGGTPFNIYLPPMATGDIQPLSPTQATQVGFGAAGKSGLQQMFPGLDPAVWDRMKVSFAPNAAVDKSGNPATEAVIIPVPPDRIPAPLPPNVNPQLVISIQAIGATSFDVPAPVTFPNLEGLAPGEKSLIFSFNHDAGRWDVIGTGSVSEDGLTVVSDPGVGIRAPGWHFIQVGTQAAGQPCTDEDCVLVEAAKEGDVIKVNIRGTVTSENSTKPDMANFKLLSISQGKWATDPDSGEVVTTGSDPFSNSGVFYFVPSIQLGPEKAGPLQQAVGRFEATLFRINPDTGMEESVTRQGIIRINLVNGWSTSGESAAPTGNLNASDIVAVYRVQHRLRYFGYQALTGNDATPVEVDGDLGPRTRHAIGVLNAAVSGVINENHQASTDVSPWINATNPPFWVEAQVPAPGMTDNENNHEHWMTSWVRNSLVAFNTAYTPSFGYNGASQRGGGDTPYHGTHEAGMDLDIDITNGEQSNAEANKTSTGALTTQEQAIVDRMVAVYNARQVPIGRILVGFQRVVNAFNTTTGTTIANLDSSDVHDNHFHVDYQPPTINAGANGSTAALLETSPVVINALSTSAVQGFGTDTRLYYRFDLSNGLTLINRSNAAGDFAEILTPNVDYILTAYQASTNRSGVYTGRASASGTPTDLGPIILSQFGGSDTDGDGVPDVGEHAIGTDPDLTDSDNDGISDAAELEQGLNPLDGRSFPTGTISSLPLPGPAEKVAVDGNRLYVAAGNGGLAIVDGTQFNNPILLGQLALSGYASSVGVDGNLGIAAVGTGSSGLQLVDVSDGMAPKLIRTVASVPASKVEVANGLAYTVSGNALRIVDLVTGQVVQSLSLPGSGTTTGFAREGTKLYAFVSGSDTFSVVDISSEGAAVVRGQVGVSVASSDVGLFVGNGIAWLSGSGLRTLDVSNPNAPTIIQLPTGSQFFTARRIALNGSGLGLLLPDGGNFLQVYDTSDPNDVSDLLLQLPLTSNASDVAISRGIAYIGSGNRLEVVNYLPFDNKKTPPTVSVGTSAADQDLIKPGLQVLEGTTLPLSVGVSDDVQVRNVELLVNGQVVANDVAFPFDFFAIAPSVSQAGDSFTLQVRATDTGGNSALSNLMTIDLIADTSAPTIVFIEPPTGASRVEPLQTVQVRFSKPMSASTVTAQTIRVRDAAGNFIAPVNFQLRDDDRFAQLTFTPLTLGDYEIVISGGVTDRVGNLLSTDDFVSPFSLTLRGMVQTSVVDADPATPGIQVYEGTTVPVAVTVVSGVSVQDVELLVNGQSIGVDGTAPYTFPVIAPNIAPGADLLTLQARIKDSAGITTLTNVMTIGLLEDMTPPEIVGVSPAPGLGAFEGLTKVAVTFSEPLAAGSVSTANFRLFKAGVSGVFDGTETEVPVTGFQLLSDDTQAHLTTAPLPIGTYQLRVSRDGITDRALNPLGTGTFASDFVLQEKLVENGDFETGDFGGWTVTQISGGSSQIVSAWAEVGSGGPTFQPIDGTRFALLKTGTIGQYQRISQEISAQPGDTITGSTFFDTSDYLPYSDNGYVRIYDANNNLVATPFSASIATVGSYGYTPWTTWQYTFTTGGTFRIEAGVANGGDSGVDSYLGLDALQLVRGLALTASSGDGASATVGTPRDLTAEALQPLVAAASQVWAEALDLPSLPPMDVVVADFPGRQLAATQAVGGPVKVIVVDDDAGGVGWFVDPTPLDHSEFAEVLGRSGLEAESGSPAHGKYDLFTVLLHEIGHALGHTRHLEGDADPGPMTDGGHGHLGEADHTGNLMNEALATSARKLPSGSNVLILGTSAASVVSPGGPSPMAPVVPVSTETIQSGSRGKTEGTERQRFDPAYVDLALGSPNLMDALGIPPSMLKKRPQGGSPIRRP